MSAKRGDVLCDGPFEEGDDLFVCLYAIIYPGNELQIKLEANKQDIIYVNLVGFKHPPATDKTKIAFRGDTDE